MYNKQTALFYFLFFFILSSSIFAQDKGTWEYIHTGNSCSTQGSSGSCMQGRHEACYVHVGDNFYLLGGRENNSNVNVYDPSKDSWTIGADAPFSIHHFQAVEYEGLIFIVGAMTGNFPNETPIDRIIIYDPLNDEWLDGPSIPVDRRRGSSGVVVANEKIYLVSGLTNGHKSGWVPYMDEYNPKTNTWRILPDAPHSRDHFHAALADNKIYAGGGRRSGEDGTFNATEGAIDIFDLDSETWTTNKNDIPTHRAAPSVAVIGDEVIYIGGEKESGNANKETEALNINTGNWRTLTSINTGRHGTQAIVNNENIWVAAGSPKRGGGTTKSQERFYFGSPTNPILSTINKSTLEVLDIHSVNNGTNSITIENTDGNQAILIQNITLTGSSIFSFNTTKQTPFVLKVGESFDIAVTHSGSETNTAEINIIHTGKNGSNSIDLNAKEFLPDPNKVYYIDNPAWNARLASTGESEDAYTTSTSTTNSDVLWKFVDKGNGYWHIQRADGGAKPRLRTDNSSNADMQATSSSGVNTYFRFPASTTSGTYYVTLPDGPSDYKKLQIDNNGDVKMVSDSYTGTWVSFKFTEASLAPSTENIAPDGTASQSTTGWGGSASRAIDKNTDGSYSKNSVTHTTNQNNAWWQVQWNENYTIDQIKIYNRTDDCCTNRLSNFTVLIIDDSGEITFSKSYTNAPNPSLTIDTNGAIGQTVKVQLNGTSPLSLAEVEVFGTLGPITNTPIAENIAPEGTASQSTTSYNASASRAIDKNTNGVWSNSSVTHTTTNRTNAWWQVQWNENYSLNQIKIYNRTDCCSDRLSNFTVSVIDDTGEMTFSKSYTSTPSPLLIIDTDGVVGRTVKVQLNGTNPLSLAEVEVFGFRTNSATERAVYKSSYFKAEKENGRKIALRWLVNQIYNPIEYEVEYQNNDGSYEVLDIIPANEVDAYQGYGFVHHRVAVGKNTYRIKILFEENRFIYLDPKTIYFDTIKAIDGINIFPNPTKNKLSIDLSNYDGQAVSLVLLDLAGKRRITKNLKKDHSSSVELDLTSLKNGLYALYIKVENHKGIVRKISLIQDY